jgi:hypothetical protein
MPRSLFAILTLATLALAGCGAAPHGGTLVLRESDGIQVAGTGEAEARPDLARVSVGVEVRRDGVATARDDAAAAAGRVISALRAAGVGEEDVQTSQLSIQPEYDYTDAGRRLLGYTARNTVSVRLRAIDRIGETVDAAVRAGGDEVRLDGLSFELSDPDAVRELARAQAMARARASAEQLARLSGVTLGGPIAIEESGGEAGPVPVMMEMRAADAATTPIEPGTTRVSVQVRVRFAIER